MPSYDAGTVEAELTLDRSKFSASIAAARKQARDFERNEIKARLGAATAEAEAKIKKVKSDLRDLDRTRVEPKIHVDRGGLATRRISLLKTALVGLAPAAVPAIAGITAATLGLAGALGAAGGALGVFGGALIGNVTQAAEMSSEITKLNEKLEETEDIAKRAEIYRQLDRIWSQMDATQREFVETLQDSKNVWDQFLTATRPQTLGVATRALQLFPDALSPLPAIVDRVTGVFDVWLSQLDGFINGPGYAGFIDFIDKQGPIALLNFTDLIANLGSGVASLVRTFTPFGQDFLATLVEGSETFRTWARDLGATSGFRTFMDYIAQTGPQVVDAISAIATAVVEIGVALAPLGGPTLGLITNVAEALGAIADIAPGLVGAGLIFATVARGIGAISDAQIAVGTRVDRFKKQFEGVTGVAGRLRAAGSGLVGLFGGPWGVALAGATVALGYLATKHAEAEGRVKELTAALRESSGAFDTNARALVTNGLEQAGALKAADKLGISLGTVTDAAINQGGELETLRTRLQAIVEAHSHVQTAGRGAVQVYDEQGRAAQDLLAALSGSNKEVNESAASARRQSEANKDVAQSTDGVKFATREAAEAYDQQRKSIEENIAALQGLIDKQKEARDQALGFQNAQIGLEQAFDDAADALKENGKTLDINTQKGRDNRQALLDVASAINEVVDSEKFRAQNGPAQLKQLDDQRGRFISLAESLGISAEAARKMADELIKTPKEITSEVNVETEQEKLDEFKKAAQGVPTETKTEGKFEPKFDRVDAWKQTLGGVQDKTETTGEYIPGFSKVEAWKQSLGGVQDQTNTYGQYNSNFSALQQWQNDLAGVPNSTSTYGNFNADTGAVRAYLGYLNAIDGKSVTAYATTVRRVETIYERRTGNLPAHGGIQKPDGGFDYSFAGGGVVPGYSPDNDRVPALLSPGEGVLRPEVVRALGEDTIHSLNRAAKQLAGSTNLQMRVPRPVKMINIENYNATTVSATGSDGLRDTAQELNLMFGGV